MIEHRWIRRGDGGRLSVELSGPEGAPAVVFGHSLMCHGRMFEAQVAALNDRYRIINLDFRGHGSSEPPQDGFTMQNQGDDYRAVLDALEIEKAAICGLSMGGMAAMHFARDHQDRLTALVLMDTSAREENKLNLIKYKVLTLMARFPGLFADYVARETVSILFSRGYRKQNPEVADYWRQSIVISDLGALIQSANMVFARPDVTDVLPSIAVPTLVIVGDQDRSTPVEEAEWIHQHLRDSRLEVIEGAGHLSAIEAPDRINTLLNNFLDQHLAPST